MNYVNQFPPVATQTTPGVVQLKGGLRGTYDNPQVEFSANVPTHTHNSLARAITPLWHTNNMTKMSATGTLDLMYDAHGDWWGNRKKGFYSGTNFTIVLNENATFRIRKGLRDYQTSYTNQVSRSNHPYGTRDAATGASSGWLGQPMSYSATECEMAITFIQDDVGGWSPTIYAFGASDYNINSVMNYTPSSSTANKMKLVLLKWVGPHAGWVCTFDSGWQSQPVGWNVSPSSSRGGQFVRAWPSLTVNASVSSEQFIEYHVKATTLNFRKWMYNAGVGWSLETVGGPSRYSWCWGDDLDSTGASAGRALGPGTAQGGWSPAQHVVTPGVVGDPVGATLHEAAHTLDNLWHIVEYGSGVNDTNSYFAKFLRSDSTIVDIHSRCLDTGLVFSNGDRDAGHFRNFSEWWAEACASWLYTKYLLSVGANPDVAQPIPYQSGSYFQSANSTAVNVLPTVALRNEFYTYLDTLLAKLI
jgi:hypothetical protein